ncbi:MAG: flagellar biosynthesis protein FliQ [Armatimonadetes bacterium]|nr:flagellar biosynthesis protein FliQ [Armatimonadota bacterium]
MTEGYILYICAQALYLILILSAPMLLSALIVGLIISIFQATTQIQEQTLSFVPKIIATFLSIVIFGTWMAGMLADFTVKLLNNIVKMGP